MYMETVFTEKEHGYIQVALFLFLNSIIGRGEDKKKIKEIEKLLSKNAKFVNKDGKL